MSFYHPLAQVGLLYVFDYKDPGVVDAIVPTRNFDDYYLFGPPRPHVSPWRGCGELSLHLLSASPAAGRPVRAGTTSGEGYGGWHQQQQ